MDESRWPGREWEQRDLTGSLSERAGAIREAAAKIGSYALFATVRGSVVLEHGRVASAIGMQSVRKALMNALVGRAVADGRLRLESTMEELGIDDVTPALTPDEKRATVRDCMMGRSGIYHPAAYEPVGLAARRPARGSHPPGEHWFYNNWDFNVLATILKQAVGLDSFRAFDEWFARPMGMQDFDPNACSEFFEDASRHPAHLFSMSARDLARFGHLYLCRGSWAGSRLLSEDWVTRSLLPHSPATHGYEAYAAAFGWMWWVMRRELLGGLPSYAALGGSGHGVFIIPDLHAIIVHRNDGEAVTPNWTDIIPVLVSTAELCRAADH
jgi:CubicO group peptidase (beta-lactamase class C family)